MKAVTIVTVTDLGTTAATWMVPYDYEPEEGWGDPVNSAWYPPGFNEDLIVDSLEGAGAIFHQEATT